MDSSPFNRSGMTRRTPPPPPSPQTSSQQQTERTEEMSTSELHNWLTSIEQCLNEVCAIASDGKLNSDQKLRINNLCRKAGHGISHMIVQYQSLKHRAVQTHNALQNMAKQQDLVESLTEIKRTIAESSPKHVSNTTSFADMVKKNTNDFIRPTAISSVAIYPSDSSKTSDETKSLVQNIVCPEEMKLRVRGVRKTRNGGVIISTESKSDLEKLKKSVELASTGLTVDEPQKRKPRVIILGIPSSMPENEVFKCIFEQNVTDKIPSMTRNTFMGSIKLSHKSGRKGEDTCNFIVQVTPEIRKALITQDRVFINWTSCPVRDFTLVTRCYKCQQYGHAAKSCKAATPTCGHCGEDGHLLAECTKKTQPPKCATCLRFKKPSNHKTGVADCPARKSAELRYINSIDYAGA